MGKKKKFYAVAKGQKPGIYDKWFGPNGAEIQIRGYASALYKGFPTKADAETWLENPIIERSVKKRAFSKKKPQESVHEHGELEKPQNDDIVIYTDGGALGNPGPGGYGVVIIDKNEVREFSGGFKLTTNNRMELTACIVALEKAKTGSEIRLYSDSRYVVDGISKGWAKKWKKNGWKKSTSEPAKNTDLWKQLLEQCDRHNVKFEWIKGHADNPGNERCDELATQTATQKDLPTDTIYEQISNHS